MTSCRRCGRKLTSQSSVSIGYGPICAKIEGQKQKGDTGVEEHRFTGDQPRVFLSFHYEDDQGPIELLRHQAKNSKQLEFVDYSAKEPWDTEEWKKKCEERIARSSVFVVAIGEKTHGRPAVLWEIRKAYELGKPVIGMRIYVDNNHIVPAPLIEHDSPVVDWKLDVLQAELDKLRERVRV